MNNSWRLNLLHAYLMLIWLLLLFEVPWKCFIALSHSHLRTRRRGRGGAPVPATGLHLCVWCGEAGECVFYSWEGTQRGGRGGHTDQQRRCRLWPSPSRVSRWTDRAHHGGQLSCTLLGEFMDRQACQRLHNGVTELYVGYSGICLTYLSRDNLLMYLLFIC